MPAETIILPFGKHKGVSIEDTPDDYLYWLSCQEWISQWPTINEYLKNNKKGIEKNAGIDKLREESDD